MKLMPVIEASDFCLAMDDAIQICGSKIFGDATEQDYLEFPMSIDIEQALDMDIAEIKAYVVLRDHILYQYDVEGYDAVLLQNYYY
jgi:hypothetical protein